MLVQTPQRPLGLEPVPEPPDQHRQHDECDDPCDRQRVDVLLARLLVELREGGHRLDRRDDRVPDLVLRRLAAHQRVDRHEVAVLGLDPVNVAVTLLDEFLRAQHVAQRLADVRGLRAHHALRLGRSDRDHHLSGEEPHLDSHRHVRSQVVVDLGEMHDRSRVSPLVDHGSRCDHVDVVSQLPDVVPHVSAQGGFDRRETGEVVPLLPLPLARLGDHLAPDVQRQQRVGLVLAHRLVALAKGGQQLLAKLLRLVLVGGDLRQHLAHPGIDRGAHQHVQPLAGVQIQRDVHLVELLVEQGRGVLRALAIDHVLGEEHDRQQPSDRQRQQQRPESRNKHATSLQRVLR